MNARSPAIALFCLTVLLSACGQRPTPAAASARQVFESFQEALFAGDCARLRAHLTATSRQVVAAMPLERLRGKSRLQVVGVREHAPFFHVEVTDPNESGRRSTFVVAREDGEMLVDLVATSAFHREANGKPAGAPSWRIEPAAVTPEQVRAAQALLERQVGSAPPQR